MAEFYQKIACVSYGKYIMSNGQCTYIIGHGSQVSVDSKYVDTNCRKTVEFVSVMGCK